jgi:hypothetical protein
MLGLARDNPGGQEERFELRLRYCEMLDSRLGGIEIGKQATQSRRCRHDSPVGVPVRRHPNEEPEGADPDLTWVLPIIGLA